MENVIKKVKLKKNRYAEIGYAEWCADPREDSNLGKMTFRENRSYKLPHEFDFDFLGFDDGEEDAVKQYNELEEKYWVFFIDCYIHSGYSFGLEGEVMQCRRDTARKAGMIIIPKEYNWYDYEERSKSSEECKKKGGMVKTTRDEAEAMARAEVLDYHKYFNGEQYAADILEERHYVCEETGEKHVERVYVEGTGVYYDIDSLEDFLSCEYNENEPLEEM